MSSADNYWFPAKRYGWGWGFPATWQGRVVLALYAASLAAVVVIFPPDADPWRFLALVLLCSAVVVAVCWLNGPPPHWSWGEKNGT